MGFIHANIIPLLKESKKKQFYGNLLLLGQGDIYFNIEKFHEYAKTSGAIINPNVDIKPSHLKSFADKGYPHCETIFKMLGFSKVSVLDYSGFEGADILHDLNASDLSEDLIEKFDCIIDHGTLEHVFHLPNALQSIFRMLKTGGRFMVSAPSGNFFDHGFYMLQPTLVADWLSINKWQVESIQVVQYTANQETEPCFFADYTPRMFDAVSYGKLDNKLYLTVAIATKVLESTGNKIPQQGAYSKQVDWVKNSVNKA